MSTINENMRLLLSLNDAWNAHDWKAYEKFYAIDVDVFWPGQEKPTHGRESHIKEVIEITSTFPDNQVVHEPNQMFFGEGEFTCIVTDLTGSFLGPMIQFDGKKSSPTGKKFKVELCRLNQWRNHEIVEEKRFYDKILLMQQIGLM